MQTRYIGTHIDRQAEEEDADSPETTNQVRDDDSEQEYLDETRVSN